MGPNFRRSWMTAWKRLRLKVSRSIACGWLGTSVRSGAKS